MKFKEVRIQIVLMLIVLLQLLSTISKGDSLFQSKREKQLEFEININLNEDNYSIKADGVVVNKYLNGSRYLQTFEY